MKNENIYHIRKGTIKKQGAYKSESDIQLCTVFHDCKSLEVVFYNQNKKRLLKVDLMPYRIVGDIYSVCIKGDVRQFAGYELLYDGRAIRDAFQKAHFGYRRYGAAASGSEYVNGFYDASFDWEDVGRPAHQFHEVIAYSLHVRGFTKHRSSGVQHKGTYLGVIEKIPYLKELGVNQLDFMPVYEFYELEEQRDVEHNAAGYEADNKTKYKVNYWGFKEAQYFLPKQQYAFSRDCISEFKTMVKELHKNGIEVVLRFYFTPEVNQSMIMDVLHHWVVEYRIDGFHLMGEHLPLEMIITDPLLMDTKLYYEKFQENLFSTKTTLNPQLCEVNRGYERDIRRYLKSDEDMISTFCYRQRRNGRQVHVINYVTSYQGFTLYDLVSYDYKHNEANGEGNQDGENYNYSWNCGCEGATRKKYVFDLRKKQMRNAFMMLFCAQGVPMLNGGDELMNSQDGNNNPYCQDNEISWLNWRMNKSSEEMLTFVKGLIRLRKSHPILHYPDEMRIMDYAACGYPDLSYHADEPWYPRMENHIRHIGMMLCGKYTRIDKTTEDDFFYIAYNMHWEGHSFGLPKLPKGLKWEYCMDTTLGIEPMDINQRLEENQGQIEVSGRSIMILKSVPDTAGQATKENGNI